MVSGEDFPLNKSIEGCFTKGFPQDTAERTELVPLHQGLPQREREGGGGICRISQKMVVQPVSKLTIHQRVVI